MIETKVALISNNARIPTKGSTNAAAFDLYACLDSYGNTDAITFAPDETIKIPTGLKMEIPTGYCGKIYARSGIATKKGLRPANCVGIIDSDYRGEVIVALHNDSGRVAIVQNGERIAQLCIEEVLDIAIQQVEESELSDTERGAGGFGSTGEK